MSKYNRSFPNKKYLVLAAVGVALLLLNSASDADIDKVDLTLKRSVVRLRAMVGRSGGTGFLAMVGGKRFTVTNWHVCRSTGTTQQMLADREDEFSDVKLKVIATDPLSDLCLLEPVPGVALTLGEKPYLFQHLYVMGHPFLKQRTAVNGKYQGEIESNMGLPKFGNEECPPGFSVQIELPFAYCVASIILGDTTIGIHPGNSGSPAVDKYGNVVGVMESLDTRTGWGGFIPVRYLKSLIEAQK